MRVTLHVIAGPATGQRIDLRTGQVAKFGRTEWADYCFPGDEKMEDIHFAITCGDHACRLISVQSVQPTLVNGDAASEMALRSGDTIVAGATALKVAIDGETESETEMMAESANRDVSLSESKTPSATAAFTLATYLELDGPAQKLAEPIDTPDQLLAHLEQEGQTIDAVRVLAHMLDKRTAIWWGCLCVDQSLDLSTLDDAQLAALDLVREWVPDPDESKRRMAEVKAQEAGYSGPGGLLAAAVFWSGDNLAPADLPEPVPPDERLTGLAVKSALLLTAALIDPAKIDQGLQGFLQVGHDLADGKIKPPSSSEN